MALPPLFDTHCHLNTGALVGEEAEAWQRARAVGLVGAIVVAIDAEHAAQTQRFVQDYDDLWASAGIHPCHVQEMQPGDLERIEALQAEDKVLAVGESGLDLFHDQSTLPEQVRVLRHHAELALELDRPLILHVRDAFPALREALEPYAGAPLRGLLHCFGGEPEDLEPWVERGFHVSFAGIITYKKAENVRAAARLVPRDRLLVETDSPYLPPVPHRGKRNEPAYVEKTARALAEVLELPFEELAELTTQNARRAFKLDQMLD